MPPISEPAGWQKVKATYDESINVKLRKDKKDDGSPVTPDDRLAAIEYWIDRLLWDAVAVQQKGKPDKP